MLVILSVIIGLSSSCRVSSTDRSNPETKVSHSLSLSESLRPSLVYIESTVSKYNMLQPWKQDPTSICTGYGTAVGPNQILTTAEIAANASLIQVRVYGRNDYLPAKVKVLDYDLNLCLLEISPEILHKPFEPVTFSELFNRDSEVNFFWLSSNSEVKSARGFLDRAITASCPTSYQNILSYSVSNTSRKVSSGELCMLNRQPAGVAFSWFRQRNGHDPIRDN